MTPAQRLWERSLEGSESALPGDLALQALLLAHSCILNSGILHYATDTEPEELKEATDAFRFFGLEGVVALMETCRALPPHHRAATERELDRRYGAVCSDALILERVAALHAGAPGAFAPLS